MAFQVEDGTGLATANSYLSVADADAYHLLYGNTDWATASDPNKEIALVRATQYIDTTYKFRGEIEFAGQALQWPRVGIVYRMQNATWPFKPIQDATAEAALRALAGTLDADVTDPQVEEEQIGPIKVKYRANEQSGQTRIRVVDKLLKEVSLGGSLHSIRVSRG